MRTRKAEAGIGTLILFIALILVAAVAAGVLISTASSLQSKALFTGSRAETQVSSQALPVYVYALDASSGSPRTVNQSYFKVKLVPGSDPIKLDEAVMQVDTADTRNTLTYLSTIDCTLTQSDAQNALWNTTANPGQNTYYGARWLSGQSNGGYLERSDVVELCFNLPEDVGEGEDLRMSFVPKVGSPTTIVTKTPDVMLDQRIELFP